MITCTLTGGIGNCLFIEATLFAFAKKHNIEYAIPATIENPHYKGQQVHRFPGLNYSDNIQLLPIFQEQQFHYKPLPFMDFVCLSGYWQSWRYFHQYRKELLEALWFKWEMKKNTCAVHVRRTDYLNTPDVHPPITKEYILEAMELMYVKMNGGVTFEIFSDDTEWCSQVMWGTTFSKFEKNLHSGKSEIEDLKNMSECENIITANSSYSWWAAYLNQNENKTVIHPKKWFGSERRRYDLRDLYLPNSIIL